MCVRAHIGCETRKEEVREKKEILKEEGNREGKGIHIIRMQKAAVTGGKKGIQLEANDNSRKN